VVEICRPEPVIQSGWRVAGCLLRSRIFEISLRKGNTMSQSYTLKANEGESRQKLEAFWNRSSLGRPALAITVTNPAYNPGPAPNLHLPQKERELTPEWQAWSARYMLHSRFYMAEAMPKAFPSIGSNLVTMTSLLGSGYSFKDDIAWIQRRPDIYTHPLPRFDPDHSFIQRVVACMEAMHQEVQGKGYISPPVFMDGLTVLSLLRGGSQLCLDLLEMPETILHWRDALSELYIEAYEFFYQKLVEFGYGDTCTWYELTAPGRFEAVQCDFSVFISPSMFKKFVLPDLEKVTAYMDYSLYHLDGTCQLRFFDLLATLPRLNGIQWNPEPGNSDPGPWLDTLREIRRRGWCLLVNDSVCNSVEAAEMITREVGPDGLFLSLPAFDTLSEAEAAIERIQKAANQHRERKYL
jgi:hypothetical protein